MKRKTYYIVGFKNDIQIVLKYMYSLFFKAVSHTQEPEKVYL